MRNFILGLLTTIIIFLFMPVQRFAAQTGKRISRLTILLNYDGSQPDFDGLVWTTDGIRPNLKAWGLEEKREALFDKGSLAWSISGTFSVASLELPESPDEFYLLRIGPLTLAPGDEISFILPFVSIDYERVKPAPDNLQALISPGSLFTRIPSNILGVTYAGGTGRTIIVEIPFSPIRKQIHLTITPVIGQMLLGYIDSFRLSGSVTYSDIHDYDEFIQRCHNDPSSLLLYRYGTADLLYALDSPPQYNFGLNPIYQFKPTYLLVNTKLISCYFDSGSGKVFTSFDGRAIKKPEYSKPYPEAWEKFDTADFNTQVKIGSEQSGRHAYELRFGDIVLAPRDVLTVTLMSSDIREVSPMPTRYEFSQGNNPKIVYEGPRRFPIEILYFPDSALVFHQIPTILRSLVHHSIELSLPLLNISGGVSTTKILVILALIVLAGGTLIRVPRLAKFIKLLGWSMAALVLFYGVYGSYGLLILAVLLYIRESNSRDDLIRNCAAIVLILAGVYIDNQATRLYALLIDVDLEITPVTPLIYLVLGLAFFALFAYPRARFERLFSRAQLPLVIVFFAFATFDVLQKSLLGFALIAAGIVFLMARLTPSKDIEYVEGIKRLEIVLSSRLVPIGFVLMIVFAAQNGLRNASAILETRCVWSPALPPLLLIFSILQGLLAITISFIVLYPMIPFKAGYLKSVTFAAFLTLIFLVGTASDARMVLFYESLVTGRFIYYIGVPLLIGVYFDIIDYMNTERRKLEAEGKPVAMFTIQQAASMYLKQVQGLISTVGAIASLIAPGAYAFFAGNPIVTTYFDILEKFISISLAAGP